MLAPVWIKGKLSLSLITEVVSKIVRLKKLIWKGEDVWFDTVARNCIGSFTGSLRSGQKAVAVTKQLGKLYCWRELMLSTKTLHYCVPVKSSFALILCVWGKNWQNREKAAERNRYFPFAMKILKGTIAASRNSNRALAEKASWCSFSKIPVAWLFQLRLDNSFIL